MQHYQWIVPRNYANKTFKNLNIQQYSILICFHVQEHLKNRHLVRLSLRWVSKLTTVDYTRSSLLKYVYTLWSLPGFKRITLLLSSGPWNIIITGKWLNLSGEMFKFALMFVQLMKNYMYCYKNKNKFLNPLRFYTWKLEQFSDFLAVE